MSSSFDFDKALKELQAGKIQQVRTVFNAADKASYRSCNIGWVETN